VDLSFHLRSSVDALRMKAMQMNLSKLGKQPNRSFASVLLAFSLFRFLHPHHTNSANARYLCESDEFEPPAKTGAIAAQTFLRHENLVYLC
jgi:hypothetical protein